jgi:O-antigen ligase
MAKKVVQSKIPNIGIANWIFLGSALITLYFNSKLQDPFNTPKLVLLMVISAWAVPHLVKDIINSPKTKLNLLISVSAAIFLISGLISSVLSGSKYVAIIGETQRKNGYLSYLALIIIFLTVSRLVKSQHLNRFYLVSLFTALLLGVYGLMQNSGLDFVKWNNPYNSIISTVGNPNFAAAIMAVMVTLLFGPILQNGYSQVQKIFSGFLIIVLVYTIYLSDARQGLISVFIGIGTYLTIWIYDNRKKIGIFLGALGLITFFFSILGMLQIGPLEKYLYKGSVTLRGYYWRTGLEMFKENPLFGVGLDRYGSYFKELRDVSYPLNYGFDITSTNAHNVPIQLFATGGVFFGLSYIVLLTIVASVAIKGLIKTSGNDRLTIASLFSAWLAFQAQSFVSIDNIGIAVWGWLLSGLVIAIATEKTSNLEEPRIIVKKQSNQINLLQPIISGIMVTLVLIPGTLLLKSESLMFQTRMRFDPTVEQSKGPLKEFSEKTINAPLVDPNYKSNVASYLVVTGFTNEGMKILQEQNVSDPRNLDTLILLSEFSERLGKPDLAASYRLQIAKYDPWNAKNYLALGRIYKSLGDINSMNQMLIKINSFASNTEEGKQANIDLVN